MSPLDDASAPPFASVMAYYDPTTDVALLGLRYDPLSLGDAGFGFLVEIAMLAEIGMIQPHELSEGDRRRFVFERLARCTLHVDDQRHVSSALTELVRKLREQRMSKPMPAERIPRGDTSDPHLLVQAKGTRDTLPKVTRAEASPGRGIPPLRASSPSLSVSPHIIPRAHRAETVQMPPDEQLQKAAETLPEPTGPASPTVIYARYLRSGRWVPLRIGALSLKGAALMSGALPRMNDHVDVALSFGSHRALVRGNVGKVSTIEEAATSGAATFSVDFRLDDASRRQLTSLLTAARAAKITIKPPPPRSARRYPVEWPVGLGTARGVVRAEALDVSKEGMFVRPLHALALNTQVTFSMMLDDGEAPAAGRARVIRHITDAEARACGLTTGYGLKIVEMGEADRARWGAFLTRIERRADKRILIGASPSRLTELQACLASAGYAVTGGTDPGALVQLASAEARPVDAALIDSGWMSPTMSGEWVESLFSARNVPCVTLHGDAKRARAVMDKLLDVAGSSTRS